MAKVLMLGTEYDVVQAGIDNDHGTIYEIYWTPFNGGLFGLMVDRMRVGDELLTMSQVRQLIKMSAPNFEAISWELR